MIDPAARDQYYRDRIRELAIIADAPSQYNASYLREHIRAAIDDIESLLFDLRGWESEANEET